MLYEIRQRHIADHPVPHSLYPYDTRTNVAFVQLPARSIFFKATSHSTATSQRRYYLRQPHVFRAPFQTIAAARALYRRHQSASRQPLKDLRKKSIRNREPICKLSSRYKALPVRHCNKADQRVFCFPVEVHLRSFNTTFFVLFKIRMELDCVKPRVDYVATYGIVEGMTAVVLVCHPEPGSFTHAVAEAAAHGLRDSAYSVTFHDLYRENFDPVMPPSELRRRFSFDTGVQRHVDDLLSAAHLVVVHPDWWGQTPAMLKGWLDRVLRPGIAYEYVGEDFSKKTKEPLLSHLAARVFITTDAPETPTPHPLCEIWTKRIFNYVGITDSAVEIMFDLRNSSRADRLAWIEHVRAFAANRPSTNP